MKQRSKKIEAKRSEMKRKIIVFVSQNEAKRKRNGFCFASFRFEAKKNKKRKWDTLARRKLQADNKLMQELTADKDR